MTCGSDATTIAFEPQTGSDCDRTIEFTHSKACADDSLSGGAIFLIVVFSLLAAYFIFGFLLCKFYFKQPTIVESIPHVTFWMSLPKLYIAGCSVAISFVKSKINGGKSGGVDSSDYDSYGATEDV
eukprot:UN04633